MEKKAAPEDMNSNGNFNIDISMESSLEIWISASKKKMPGVMCAFAEQRASIFFMYSHSLNKFNWCFLVLLRNMNNEIQFDSMSNAEKKSCVWKLGFSLRFFIPEENGFSKALN